MGTAIFDHSIFSWLLDTALNRIDSFTNQNTCLEEEEDYSTYGLQELFFLCKFSFFGLIHPIVNRQCVVYSFSCDLCDSDYVGFTARHLHQRIVEHKYSAIGKHFSTAHGDTSLLKESQFRILKKCQGKFDCLIYEMLFIKKRNPSLSTQTDSIRAKLFV